MQCCANRRPKKFRKSRLDHQTMEKWQFYIISKIVKFHSFLHFKKFLLSLMVPYETESEIIFNVKGMFQHVYKLFLFFHIDRIK